MDIGEKIKFLRTEFLGLSQDKFAKKINVTRLTVKKWEDGISKPTTAHITMIAVICGVTTDYLIYDKHPLELSLMPIGDEEYRILHHVISYFKKQNEKTKNI